MIECTRRLEFDAAHRVMNHESKCATLHGHRYVVEVTARPVFDLDAIGRVVDFSVIRAKVGKWLDENWDHNVILYSDDYSTVELVKQMPQKKPPAIVPFNPTAENMAEYLLSVVCPTALSEYAILVTKVRVYETPNCYAEAAL